MDGGVKGMEGWWLVGESGGGGGAQLTNLIIGHLSHLSHSGPGTLGHIGNIKNRHHLQFATNSFFSFFEQTDPKTNARMPTELEQVCNHHHRGANSNTDNRELILTLRSLSSSSITGILPSDNLVSRIFGQALGIIRTTTMTKIL